MGVPKAFNKNFFDAWSSEMAYILGFLFADGSVWCGKRGGWYFSFYANDREIIESIRRALGAEHKIGEKRENIDFTRSHSLYSLQIGSRAVCERLGTFGIIPNKSLIVRFPAVPQEYLGHFIRGYFDGDGCVSFKRYWRKDRRLWKYQLTARFTSGSKVFLEGLWRALCPYTKGGHINTKQRGYELVFGQHDAFALYGLMYNNIASSLFLERKQKIFREARAVIDNAVVV